MEEGGLRLMGGNPIPSPMDIMVCEECDQKFRRGGSKRTRDGRHRCPGCFGINTRIHTPEDLREAEG